MICVRRNHCKDSDGPISSVKECIFRSKFLHASFLCSVSGHIVLYIIRRVPPPISQPAATKYNPVFFCLFVWLNLLHVLQHYGYTELDLQNHGKT